MADHDSTKDSFSLSSEVNSILGSMTEVRARVQDRLPSGTLGTVDDKEGDEERQAQCQDKGSSNFVVPYSKATELDSFVDLSE